MVEGMTRIRTVSQEEARLLLSLGVEVKCTDYRAHDMPVTLPGKRDYWGVPARESDVGCWNTYLVLEE